MIGFLPLIVIGGLFYPPLGFLVLAMMAFFLPFSFFKGRYWCSHLCPRGAFLDLVLSKISFNKPLPRLFSRQWFRWSVFIFVMTLFVFRLISAGANPLAIGVVFVSMCLLTTIVAIILGIVTKHRGWCAMCPMGFMQEKINTLNRRKPGVK